MLNYIKSLSFNINIVECKDQYADDFEKQII